MSQDSVLKILEKKKDWLTTRQIAESLGISQGTALKALSRLLYFKEIDRKEGRIKGEFALFYTFMWRAK